VGTSSVNSATPNPVGYRADVDTLRAVSVLAVFLFHLDIGIVSGGFVGVDVFYVISGYVIFRSVLDDVAADRFSLRAFWRRRVCRILPALALTVLACILLGWWLMTPAEYANFGNSAMSAIFSVSNFYFNDRLQYFGDSAREVPLVHTWSLGVEEQFYLTAPLLVYWLVRRKRFHRLLPILAAIVGLSFAYNLFAVYGLSEERHAFYLPMSRFWEIAVGGCIACWERQRTQALPFARWLAWIGVGGIVIATVSIDTNTLFPGFAAVLPVGAAALFLATGLPVSGVGGRLFQSAPLVFLGRISYSTYLFHWPAITFYTIAAGETLTAGISAIIFIGTLALATLSWRFVETPFRRYQHRGSAKQPVLIALGVSAGVAVLALSLQLTHGVPSRMEPPARAILATMAVAPAEPRDICRVGEGLPTVARGVICAFGSKSDKIDYVLWGESHAGMYREALAQQTGLTGVLATMPDCPALIDVYTSKRKNRDECRHLQQTIMGLVRERHVPTVVLAGRWANLASPVRSPGDGSLPKTIFDGQVAGPPVEFGVALRRTVQRFKEAGARVVVIGPVPEVSYSVPSMMVRAAHLGHPIPAVKREGFERRQVEVLAALASLENLPGVRVVYPHQILCDSRTCRTSDGAKPLYRDDDHLSFYGSALIAPAILQAIAR
jgi:peptidoglycan/LPS O-acetylase OafA/YrhL